MVVPSPVLTKSGIDAYNIVPIGRLLVGLCGPHKERVEPGLILPALVWRFIKEEATCPYPVDCHLL